MTIKRFRELMQIATSLEQWVYLVNKEQARPAYHTGSWDMRR